MRVIGRVALSFLMSAAAVCGCGVGTNGLGPPAPDASADAETMDAATDTNPLGADAGPDAPLDAPSDTQSEAAPPNPCNASTCGGACCGTQCVPRTCAGCALGGVFCPYAENGTSNGTCVADCSSCNLGSSSSIACFTCYSTGLLAQCASSANDCPAAADAGACPCPSGSAEQCPGSDQTCSMVDGEYVCLSQ